MKEMGISGLISHSVPSRNNSAFIPHSFRICKAANANIFAKNNFTSESQIEIQ